MLHGSEKVGDTDESSQPPELAQRNPTASDQTGKFSDGELLALSVLARPPARNLDQQQTSSCFASVQPDDVTFAGGSICIAESSLDIGSDQLFVGTSSDPPSPTATSKRCRETSEESSPPVIEVDGCFEEKKMRRFNDRED
jgi:hypothetical protein